VPGFCIMLTVVADQVSEVDKVKRSESGMIVEPVTLPADARVSDALAVMERYHISGVPITEADGKLVVSGVATNGTSLGVGIVRIDP